MLSRDRAYFLLLNIGHFLDHYFLLIFATAAALALTEEWQISYAALIPYATPGFVAFGLGALPAGWLADRWSRDGMMAVFFWGIGLASIGTGFAMSPIQIGLGLFVIGLFAAIYHPVGLAIVTTRWRKSGMKIAVNGVWGNLGVGCATLVTGILISHISWRAAFILPGALSCLIGFVYVKVARDAPTVEFDRDVKSVGQYNLTPKIFWRMTAAVFVIAILGGIVFQATTFALPKIFDERLTEMAAALSQMTGSEVASIIGLLTFVVFAAASMAQLLIGFLLDRGGQQQALLGVALVQMSFFLLMQGQSGMLAYGAALGFMLGVFGQIPINDYLIGAMAAGRYRARVFGLRYLVSFSALAFTLPMIAVIHETRGFDALFLVLAALAGLVGAISLLLPKSLAPAN